MHPHFKKSLSLIFLVLCLSFLPCQFASAQILGGTGGTGTSYKLLAPLPNLQSPGTTMESINLSDYISYAYKFMLALAVVLAVIMITIGGFEYMLSGAANTKSDALKKISDAVWGLILALVTYMILYTIDPNLILSNNSTVPPISPSGNSSAQTNGGGTPADQTQQSQINLAG